MRTGERGAPGIARKSISFLPLYWAHRHAWKPRLRFLDPAPAGDGRPAFGLKIALRFIGGFAGSSAVALLLALGLFVCSARSADVVAHPAYITGQVQFNTHPQIAERLSHGAEFFWMTADSIDTTPRLSTSAAIRSTAPPWLPPYRYNLVVEGDSVGTGIRYTVGGRLIIFYGPTEDPSKDEQEYYLAGASTTGLLGGETAPVDLTECAGILDVHFQESDGTAVYTSGKGSLWATNTDVALPVNYQAANDGRVPEGTGYRLVVQSGHHYRLAYRLAIGTDAMLDRHEFTGYVDVGSDIIGCGELRTVPITLPTPSSFGGLSGVLSLAGETLLRETDAVAIPPDPYTLDSIMAAITPGFDPEHFAQSRFTFLDRPISSGSFELPSLIPSEQLGGQPYKVFGRMQFREGQNVNLFRTPFLPVNVLPNTTPDLGNAFIMTPGANVGRVTLRGRAGMVGSPSPFRSLRWIGDGNASRINDYSYSSIKANGIDRVPTGGGRSADGGVAFCSFGGAVAADGTFTGNYELMLAGLAGEPSDWKLSALNLAFNSGPGVDPFMQGGVFIEQNHVVTVVPGDTHTYDMDYCFGEVRFRFSTTSGTLFNPTVEAREEDVRASWTAAGFQGTPLAQADARPTGEVLLFLPEGRYTLTPQVKIVGIDGGVNTLILPAQTNFLVRCGGGRCVDSCLSVNVTDMPACAADPSVHITGNVASCTNVARIVWDQGDNIQHTICENCGINPSFAFELPVSDPCQAQAFTVTAYDVNGVTCYDSETIPADRTAPTLQCPTNVLVQCAGPKGAPAYFAPLVTDNCDPNPFLTCVPASGSWFQLGDAPVTCYAKDRCGNSSQCSFTVTVTTNCPPCIEMHCPTSLVAYTCGSNCVSVPFTVTATDRCNSNQVSVVTDLPSGHCFSLGTTWVHATAYGSGQSEQCSFPVTVLLNTNCPPATNCVEIHCPTNVIRYTCGSNCVPVDYTVTANNNCSPNDLSLAIDLPTGTCFRLGTTWVHATASGSGQTKSCSFPVTVLCDTNCPPATDCSCCLSNLLVNGSFESPGVPDGYVSLAGGDAVITGWVTMLNGVQYYNPVVAPSFVNTGFAADGNYLIDLAPAMGLGGGIQQTFATVPGRSYRVCFALGTSKERGRTGTASVTVIVAGTAHAFNITTASSSISWERKQFSFVATSTRTTLLFCTLDDPALSFVNLDAVCVSDCCTDSGLKIKPTVTIEWECGILQSAPAVTGPYTDVSGATSPYTVAASEARRFFRTRP